jgi:hypothetical protein
MKHPSKILTVQVTCHVGPDGSYHPTRLSALEQHAMDLLIRRRFARGKLPGWLEFEHLHRVACKISRVWERFYERVERRELQSCLGCHDWFEPSHLFRNLGGRYCASCLVNPGGASRAPGCPTGGNP